MNMPEPTQFDLLLHDCHEAIEDANVEQCLKLLLKSVERKSSIYDDIRQQSALYRSSSRDNNNALLSRDQYRKEYSQTINALLTLLKGIKEEDCIFTEDIHERILIFTFENSMVDWADLFSRRKFTHCKIIHYDTPVPEVYRNPAVVIFDDSGPSARPYMVQCAAEMPQAHFLYFGEANPFTESRKRNQQDAAIFDRCANANSKFTVHARLRELLEFRKIYGSPALPASANSSNS
jgi:hypothetical protein